MLERELSTNKYFTFLFKHMFGYRKGYSTQNALIVMLEKWRRTLDKKGFSAVVLMDLSKAFVTINHDLY